MLVAYPPEYILGCHESAARSEKSIFVCFQDRLKAAERLSSMSLGEQGRAQDMEGMNDESGGPEGESISIGDDSEIESNWGASPRQQSSDADGGGIVQLLAEREQLLRSVY